MRRALLALALLVVLGGGGTASILLWNERQTRDIVGSPSTEFLPSEQPAASTRPPRIVHAEPWPTYGFNARRTRVAPEFDHRPPFRRVWMVRGGSLIEFPPVVAYGSLYVGTNHGRLLAIDAGSGHIAWERSFGRCIAASPTVADGLLYVALMDPSPCPRHRQEAAGYVVALDARSGRERWRFEAGVVESSPLVVDGTLYVGSWDRRVWALDASSGKAIWSYRTGDKVKGGAAYAKGTVFVGSYDGRLYALDAKSGKLRWSASAQSSFGSTGNFYATPAVAYGRVYIGNTDGRVYAFGAASGSLLWSHGTDGYVYGSAAVWRRTVFVGSYDGRLYALDAATGRTRWRFDARGPISGSPTVLAGVVYVSTLERRTYGLDARSGRELWRFDDGKYSPLVADGKRVYLTGYTRVYGLEPRR